MSKSEKIKLYVQDTTGQRECLADVDTDATWGETMNSILVSMALPRNNPSTGTIWAGRLEREGRHLHASEVVGQSLQDNDRIVLQPELVAA